MSLSIASYAVHPRFGPVRCLSALYNIQAGQEITTDYKLVKQQGSNLKLKVSRATDLKNQAKMIYI